MKLEETMTSHNGYLREIGMVTNVSKTELTFFTKKPCALPTLTVEGQPIVPSQQLKVLGVNFSSNLSWDFHIDNVVRKAKPILLKLKFLTKYLDTTALKKVATSHFYGTVYYGYNSTEKSCHLALLRYGLLRLYSLA